MSKRDIKRLEKLERKQRRELRYRKLGIFLANILTLGLINLVPFVLTNRRTLRVEAELVQTQALLRQARRDTMEAGSS